MIDLLMLLLPSALQCVDGGSRRPKHVAAALLAFPIDLVLARTTFTAAVGRGPQNGEKTISDMLENLCAPSNSAHPDYWLLVEVARKINRVSPTGNHIKVVLTF